jgi:hypothetical protein
MWCDRDIAAFILHLHCVSWQVGICPENEYEYQIMQVLQVTLLRNIQVFRIFRINKSFLLRCKWNNANDFQSFIPIKPWAKISSYCIIFPAASLYSYAEMPFPFIVPITNLLSFPTVTESLNLHEFIFYSSGSLNMFWIIEMVEASVPCQTHLVQNKKSVFYLKYKRVQPLSPTLNCGRMKEACVCVVLELMIFYRLLSL